MRSPGADRITACRSPHTAPCHPFDKHPVVSKPAKPVGHNNHEKSRHDDQKKDVTRGESAASELTHGQLVPLVPPSCAFQCVPRSYLNGSPRCPLPGCASRTRGRMLHPARVEGGPPALLVVTGELEVVALPRHAHSDVSDATPAVEPAMEGMNARAVAGLQGGGSPAWRASGGLGGQSRRLPDDLAVLVEKFNSWRPVGQHAQRSPPPPRHVCEG